MEEDLKTISTHVKNSNQKASEQINAMAEELEALNEENKMLRNERDDFERQS